MHLFKLEIMLSTSLLVVPGLHASSLEVHGAQCNRLWTQSKGQQHSVCALSCSHASRQFDVAEGRPDLRSQSEGF